ncbi:hypothetical protein R3P38DRAFT_2800745 [Favolaschia claudopus]|uniref:Uncharacterized protein n=1 Tax=Favolaschia claudopus TaxID=2862362 RepID=A0AAV9ZYZ0_9AGAR
MVGSLRMAQQVSLTCYMASNGNRRVKTGTLIAHSILHRLPWGYNGGLQPAEANHLKVLKYWDALNIYGNLRADTSALHQLNASHWSLVFWTRFRDIDFNGYRHCVNPNTPIEAIRNPASQCQSRDVKVGNNPRAQTLSFGKEIEGYTIQQGSVRVNNGMQQDIGELATQTSPLSQSQCLVIEQSLGDIAWNAEENPSYGNGEFCAKFRTKGPRNSGIMGKRHSVGRNSGQIISKHPQFEEFWANETSASNGLPCTKNL